MRDLVTNPDTDRFLRDLANAHVHLCKAAGDAVKTDALSGRLYFSSSGWLLLSVPNALGQGAFDALDEAGVELPTSKSNGRYNAHITVMRPDEIEQIGGPAKITERGHSYRYSLGVVKEVVPEGQADLAKVWYITVDSPDLRELRKSYGLTPLPANNQHDFHITIGQRKKKVLLNNPTSKAAALISVGDLPKGPFTVCGGCGSPNRSDGSCVDCGSTATKKIAAEEKRGPEAEYCPHCDARLERDPYSGTCNGCGKDWPEKKSAAESLLDLFRLDAAETLLKLAGPVPTLDPRRAALQAGMRRFTAQNPGLSATATSTPLPPTPPLRGPLPPTPPLRGPLPPTPPLRGPLPPTPGGGRVTKPGGPPVRPAAAPAPPVTADPHSPAKRALPPKPTRPLPPKPVPVSTPAAAPKPTPIQAPAPPLGPEPTFLEGAVGRVQNSKPLSLAVGGLGMTGVVGGGTGLGLLGDRWRVKTLANRDAELRAKYGLPAPPPQAPDPKWWRR